jgi:hypothetical protein
MIHNSLIELRWSFTTTQPSDAAFNAQLARADAPVIYPDVADTKLEVPLQVDYDGDLPPLQQRRQHQLWAESRDRVTRRRRKRDPLLHPLCPRLPCLQSQQQRRAPDRRRQRHPHAQPPDDGERVR